MSHSMTEEPKLQLDAALIPASRGPVWVVHLLLPLGPWWQQLQASRYLAAAFVVADRMKEQF